MCTPAKHSTYKVIYVSIAYNSLWVETTQVYVVSGPGP